MAALDSKNNEQQVVDAVKVLSNSSAKVLAIIKQTVDKSADVDKKNIDKFKSIMNLSKDYVGIITDTLKALSASVPNGDIKQLLGYVETEVEVNRDGKTESREVKETKFAVVDGLIQMTQLFTSINKLIEQIANTKYGNIARAKANVLLFQSNLEGLIGTMTETLKSTSASLNSDSIKMLMGEETTEKFSNYIKAKETIFHDSKDGKTVLKGETEKAILEKQSEKTTKNYGILDVMERYLTLMGTIGSFKAPSLLGTFIQMNLAKISMEMILDKFKGLVDYATQIGLNKETVDEYGHTLEAIATTFDESVMSIVMSLMEITKRVNPATEWLIRSSLTFLYDPSQKLKDTPAEELSIIPYISKLLKSPAMKNIAEASKDDSILEQAKQSIGSIAKLVQTIATLGDPKMLANLKLTSKSLKETRALILSMYNLIDSIPESSEEQQAARKAKIKSVLDSVTDVKEMIDSLASISKSAVLLGVLALPAALGLMMGSLFVAALGIFIKVIGKELIWAVGDKDFANVKNQIHNIAVIIAELALVGLTVIALGLIAPLILSSAANVVLAVFALSTVILAVRAMVYLYELLDGRASAQNVKKGESRTLLAMLMIAGVLGAMVVMVLELVILSQVIKLVDWKYLLIGLGALAVTMLLVIGLGALMAAWGGMLSIFVAVAAAVTAAILFIISSLIIIAAELILFSLMDLTKYIKVDVITKNVGAISDSIKAISLAIWGAYSQGAGIIKMALVTAWLAVSIFTVGAMILIAGALIAFTWVADNVEESQVRESVEKILHLSRHIVDIAIGGEGVYDKNGRVKSNPEDESLVTKLLSGVGSGAIELVKSILAFANLAAVALSVAVLWGVATMLQQVVKIELNEGDITNAVNNILLCADKVSGAVMAGGKTEVESKKQDKGIFGKVGDFIKGGYTAVSGAIGNLASSGVLATALLAVTEVQGLAMMLEKIQDVKINESDITTKVNQIIRCSNLVARNVAKNDGSPYTIDVAKVKPYGQYVDDSVKLMKQVNKLDTDKLLKYTDMWKQMTEFMEQVKNLDITELSEAIVDKIAPAMEGISKNVGTMSKFQSNVNIPSPVSQPTTIAPTPTNPDPKPVETQKQPDNTGTEKLLEDIKELLTEYFESRQ